MSLGILRLIICRPVSTLSQPNLALALLIVLLCPACFHVLSTVLLVSYRRVNRGRWRKERPAMMWWRRQSLSVHFRGLCCCPSQQTYLTTTRLWGLWDDLQWVRHEGIASLHLGNWRRKMDRVASGGVSRRFVFTLTASYGFDVFFTLFGICVKGSSCEGLTRANSQNYRLGSLILSLRSLR